MKKNSEFKHRLLKCWIRLAAFFKWVEQHPLVDRFISLFVKVLVYIIADK